MRKKYLISLFIVFPLIVGFIFYSYYFYSPMPAIRHGVLLQPPLDTKNLNMFITNDQRWQIAYVPSVCCNPVCGKELLQLNQLQKELAKNGKPIHLKLVAKQACEVHDSTHIFMEAISMQQVKQFQAALTQPGETTFDMTDKIYIIDSQQKVFVYYSSKDNPTDILHDLRRVLI